MIVEIGDTLVNTDNICSIDKIFKSYSLSRPTKEYDVFWLQISFVNGKIKDISFTDKQSLEVAYQTLKFVETVIKK